MLDLTFPHRCSEEPADPGLKHSVQVKTKPVRVLLISCVVDALMRKAASRSGCSIRMKLGKGIAPTEPVVLAVPGLAILLLDRPRR